MRTQRSHLSQPLVGQEHVFQTNRGNATKLIEPEYSQPSNDVDSPSQRDLTLFTQREEGSVDEEGSHLENSPDPTTENEFVLQGFPSSDEEEDEEENDDNDVSTEEHQIVEESPTASTEGSEALEEPHLSTPEQPKQQPLQLCQQANSQQLTEGSATDNQPEQESTEGSSTGNHRAQQSSNPTPAPEEIQKARVEYLQAAQHAFENNLNEPNLPPILTQGSAAAASALLGLANRSNQPAQRVPQPAQRVQLQQNPYKRVNNGHRLPTRGNRTSFRPNAPSAAAVLPINQLPAQRVANRQSLPAQRDRYQPLSAQRDHLQPLRPKGGAPIKD